MSPEQASGNAQVDARSDQYSLGASLYEMLTGEPPFRGTPAMVVHQVLADDPRSPRQLNEAIPRELETICLKTLSKDPRRALSLDRASGRRSRALAAWRADHRPSGRRARSPGPVGPPQPPGRHPDRHIVPAPGHTRHRRLDRRRNHRSCSATRPSSNEIAPTKTRSMPVDRQRSRPTAPRPLWNSAPWHSTRSAR